MKKSSESNYWIHLSTSQHKKKSAKSSVSCLIWFSWFFISYSWFRRRSSRRMNGTAKRRWAKVENLSAMFPFLLWCLAGLAVANARSWFYLFQHITRCLVSAVLCAALSTKSTKLLLLFLLNDEVHLLVHFWVFLFFGENKHEEIEVLFCALLRPNNFVFSAFPLSTLSLSLLLKNFTRLIHDREHYCEERRDDETKTEKRWACNWLVRSVEGTTGSVLKSLCVS